MSKLLKKFSVSGITVESKILFKNAEYWVIRSPMGFQGSGGQLQECSMKKIVVIELFIVFVFLTPRYKSSPIGPGAVCNSGMGIFFLMNLSVVLKSECGTAKLSLSLFFLFS